MSSGKFCPSLNAPGHTTISWLVTSVARKLSKLQQLDIIAEFSSPSAPLSSTFVNLSNSTCNPTALLFQVKLVVLLSSGDIFACLCFAAVVGMQFLTVVPSEEALCSRSVTLLDSACKCDRYSFSSEKSWLDCAGFCESSSNHPGLSTPT